MVYVHAKDQMTTPATVLHNKHTVQDVILLLIWQSAYS